MTAMVIVLAPKGAFFVVVILCLDLINPYPESLFILVQIPFNIFYIITCIQR